MALDRVAEAGLPQAVLREALEVDLAARELVLVAEPLGFGEPSAVLADEGVAVPGEVRGRFAEPGCRVEVGGQTAGRLALDEQTSVVGLADRDVGGREVEQDRRAGERGHRGGRDRHPQVLADLDVEHEPGLGRHPEEKPATERDAALVAQVDRLPGCRIPGRELASLVELPVVRQVRLRDHPEHAALTDHDRAVVEQVVDLDRHADHGGEREGLRGGHNLPERVETAVEQRPLLEEILAGIPRQPELGKEREDRLPPGRAAHSLDRLVAVERRVRHTHLRRRHGDTDEVVAVEVEEALAGFHGCLEIAATPACSSGKRAAPAPRVISSGLEILRMGISRRG